jgi:hypothetical protein
MCAAVRRLLTDKQACELLAERAYQEVAQRFSFATRMKRIVDVYEELALATKQRSA